MPACPSCGSADITRIEIDLDAGGLEFFSCRTCEEKWWQREGESIDLAEVIDLTGTTGRTRQTALR